MGRPDGERMARVASRDGTEIACWISGQGPPLVLVHGTPADHSRFGPLLPHLEPHATVWAMDRRGRGGSGDGPDYRVAREFEDVAAVVDAAAARWDAAVDVYGHSFGGLCAFGAATLTASVRRLVLYEGWPPLDPQAHAFPAGVGERLDGLLAAGDPEAAVELVFRELLQMADEDLAAFRAQPTWPGRVAAAHTIGREIRAMPEAAFDAGWAARLTVPTLLLTGSDSADPAATEVDTVAAALPDARVVVLHGHGHVADVLAPQLFAGHLIDFLRERA